MTTLRIPRSAARLPGQAFDRQFSAACGGVALVCGVAIALSPLAVVALVGAVLTTVLILMPRVPHLVLLLGVTALVPFGVQNTFSVGGGSGSPGLFISDVLLISGLLRAVPYICTRPLPKRLRAGALLVGAFLAIAALQLVRALALGRNASTAGAEFRVLLGFGAFLVAIPVLCDERQRRSLMRALPWLGLAAGLWGLAQWLFGLQFTAAADAGVQQGIRFTTAGRGQLLGGLFAFPVATILALAALMSDEVRALRDRLLLLAVLVLNLLCLLLTYERTFWIATVLASGVVVLKAGGIQRFRALVAGGAVVLLAFTAMATFAPAELTAARERLVSLGQYGDDDSVRFRLAESRHVLDEIQARPLVGSGLAATILFGRPWDQVLPESLTFSHNGYLWLAWKLGIPGALLLLSLLFWSVGWFHRPSDGSIDEAVRNGACGALLALVIASMTFPSFNQLAITAVIGVLMAIACAPRSAPRRRSHHGDVVAAPVGISSG